MTRACNEVSRKMAWLVSVALVLIAEFMYAGPVQAQATLDDAALVVVGGRDESGLRPIIGLITSHGGEVPHVFPPNALIANLPPGAEAALRQAGGVLRVERRPVDPDRFGSFGGQARVAARAWNRVFQALPDPRDRVADRSIPAEDRRGPDGLGPSLQELSRQGAVAASTADQTSEYMAGDVRVTVAFIENLAATCEGCSCVDSPILKLEAWSQDAIDFAMSEIVQGLDYWATRESRPWIRWNYDNLGIRHTGPCEPIGRPWTHGRVWVSDALRLMGRSSTAATHKEDVRSLVKERMNGTDWGFMIFVVNSANDVDGYFADGTYAWAYVNGPYLVMTSDNGDLGPTRMNLATAHETGHIFGALDEYRNARCSPTDRSGYLNVPNASCNNGGDVTDVSIMGEYEELTDPSATVSASARDAVGWRNPVENVVDVVRTSKTVLTQYAPDPATDRTPTLRATASNKPFPPGGCNTSGLCHAPMSISQVMGARWKRDGAGAYGTTGLVAVDGAFDFEASEKYRFTPAPALPPGTYTFRTYSINNFGHRSTVSKDVLTVQ